MTAYTVHEPRAIPADALERADSVCFVKEGVAWWALIAPLVWLIYHRMWIVLVGFIVAMALVQLGLSLAGVGEAATGWCSIALTILFALFANDLRRWTLERRGFATAGAVTGANMIEAELKYFSIWQPDENMTPVQDIAATLHPGETGKDKKSGGEEPVIGLFPGTEK